MYPRAGGVSDQNYSNKSPVCLNDCVFIIYMVRIACRVVDPGGILRDLTK